MAKTPHKNSEVIKAWADGKPVQYWYLDKWLDMPGRNAIFDDGWKYRLKPEPKEIWVRVYEVIRDDVSLYRTIQGSHQFDFPTQMVGCHYVSEPTLVYTEQE